MERARLANQGLPDWGMRLCLFVCGRLAPGCLFPGCEDLVGTWSLLAVAYKLGHAEMATKLLSFGADPTRALLRIIQSMRHHPAARRGSERVALRLVEAGALPNSLLLVHTLLACLSSVLFMLLRIARSQTSRVRLDDQLQLLRLGELLPMAVLGETPA